MELILTTYGGYRRCMSDEWQPFSAPLLVSWRVRTEWAAIFLSSILRVEVNVFVFFFSVYGQPYHIRWVCIYFTWQGMLHWYDALVGEMPGGIKQLFHLKHRLTQNHTAPRERPNKGPSGLSCQELQPLFHRKEVFTLNVFRVERTSTAWGWRSTRDTRVVQRSKDQFIVDLQDLKRSCDHSNQDTLGFGMNLCTRQNPRAINTSGVWKSGISLASSLNLKWFNVFVSPQKTSPNFKIVSLIWKDVCVCFLML